MIIAVGTDIVEIQRLRSALTHPATGERFRRRIFTPAEIEYCARRRRFEESFAARFAAKEAVVKALGQACTWLEIEVQRADGRPEISLSGKTATLASRLGIRRWHLSLSHSEGHAVAFVVAEG